MPGLPTQARTLLSDLRVENRLVAKPVEEAKPPPIRGSTVLGSGTEFSPVTAKAQPMIARDTAALSTNREIDIAPASNFSEPVSDAARPRQPRTEQPTILHALL